MSKEIEPQQPEGELAECPTKSCSFKVELSNGSRFVCTAHDCTAYEYAETQLAHDKQRMVSIDWLFERCPHSEPLTLTTRHECDECLDELLNTHKESK